MQVEHVDEIPDLVAAGECENLVDGSVRFVQPVTATLVSSQEVSIPNVSTYQIHALPIRNPIASII